MPINALRSGLGVLLLPVLLLSAGTLRAETVAPSPLTGLELVGQALSLIHI